MNYIKSRSDFPWARFAGQFVRIDIELKGYATIIACMLVRLRIGRKPTLRACKRICWYFSVTVSEDEGLAHSACLQKQEQPRQGRYPPSLPRAMGR